MRVGMGYDVHRLVFDRKLILGGVEIPYEKGLLGHSDADVLLHAIMDALLGAAALGDIGRHFPDTDERYKDVDSMVLLSEVKRLLEENLYVIENIDATVVACSVYRSDEREYSELPVYRERSCKYQGNDRGKAGIYRRGPWYQFSGNMFDRVGLQLFK